MLPGLTGALKATKLQPLKKGDPNEMFPDFSTIKAKDGSIKE